MRVRSGTCGLIFFVGVLPFIAAMAEEPGWYINFSSQDYVEATEKGVVTATNGIVVKYGGTVLTARKATVDQNTGFTQAEGDVRIEREGQVWKGERIRYNFKNGEI